MILIKAYFAVLVEVSIKAYAVLTLKIKIIYSIV
jgi:hypothetical protein